MATREEYELSEQAFYESLLGKSNNWRNTMQITELIQKVGELSHNSREMYKQYKALKEEEDYLRAELTSQLTATGLMSAKTEQFTASLSKKQSIVVADEKKAIDWIKQEGLDLDYFVGLNQAHFKSMAMEKLKNTGEVVDGTTLVETETLSIREAKKK